MAFVEMAAASVWAALGHASSVLWSFLWNFPWQHLIDIAIMTCIVYQAYIRFRGTRAMRVLAGLAFLGLAFLTVQAGGLFLTSWLLGGIWAAALIFVIVIFQVEIRQILEQMNPRLPTGSILRRARAAGLPEEVLVTIAQAAFGLAAKRIGAIFVFERHDPLELLMRSPGTAVDAEVSPELVETLLTPLTPLHDGALYVRGRRIYRAGCVLPLSENRALASFYGTRHRAALGISEQSDALGVVVSEERGTVSVVEKGTLHLIATGAELLSWLTDRLTAPSEERKRWRFAQLLVTHNWRPKLAALAAVGVLWFVLVGQQNAEVGLSVPVAYFNVPKDLTIDDKQVQEVYVRVRGSGELLKFLNPGRLRVAVDLKDAGAGWQPYTILTKDINLPLGLQLIEVNPSQIWLTLRQKPSESDGAKK